MCNSILAGTPMSDPTFKFVNALKYYKGEPQQIKFAALLDEAIALNNGSIPAGALSDAIAAWRQPPPKPVTPTDPRAAAIAELREECQKYGMSLPQTSYLMATVEHETANTFQPIREYGDNAYFTEMYEGRDDLGNTEPGDGARFCGRGYVQITGRRNYTKYAQLTGKDLVGNPDLALDPAIARFIICDGMINGVFTGMRLDEYINQRSCDYYNARRIINGTDRAGHIANLAKLWEEFLKQNP
jgi:putative chitinase